MQESNNRSLRYNCKRNMICLGAKKSREEKEGKKFSWVRILLPAFPPMVVADISFCCSVFRAFSGQNSLLSDIDSNKSKSRYPTVNVILKFSNVGALLTQRERDIRICQILSSTLPGFGKAS
ncbi:uncharacterized protein LOC127802476 [Diospyros lotus]|uniref:uncharacterized protein LOC127802476 n=1 Tax=Diospyros lotus TaxID=55363 RepID=UPI00225A293F|nr:uncharacterized protein LOC127802476 [Diospyros lotus]